jgi:hypothetical protein
MPKPRYTGPRELSDAATETAKQQAAESGLPQIDGKQAMGYARMAKARSTPVTWYTLEDGTEAVRDDDGNPVDWPE